MILWSEGATKMQEDEAHMILDALTVAYPNHPWAVRVYDGGFFIRHLDFPDNWGMNCRTSTSLYSASAMKRKIILMAGEWLERANLKRGVGEDISPTRVEGVPEKYQPHQPLPEGMKIVAGSSEERTTARPQALIQAAG